MEDGKILMPAPTFSLLRYHLSCGLWKTLLRACETMQWTRFAYIKTVLNSGVLKESWGILTRDLGTYFEHHGFRVTLPNIYPREINCCYVKKKSWGKHTHLNKLNRFLCSLSLLYVNGHGPAQIMPLFNDKILYYKIISMWFCNITISYSSTPYDILGEMFKLKL